MLSLPQINLIDMEYLKNFLDEVDQNEDVFSIYGCVDSSKLHLALSYKKDKNIKIYIAKDDVSARRILNDTLFFNVNACYYPYKDVLFYSSCLSSNDVIKSRLECIYSIINAKKNNEQLLVITTANALFELVLPLYLFEENIISLKKGDIIKKEDLIEKLVFLGYKNTFRVENVFEFSSRGYIVDIFPIDSDFPVRIDFFDDEIESIKYFDETSQRSIKEIEEFSIFSATEYLFSKDEIKNGISSLNKEFEILKKENIEDLDTVSDFLSNIITKSSYEQAFTYFSKNFISFIDYFDTDCLFIFDEINDIEKTLEDSIIEITEYFQFKKSVGTLLTKKRFPVLSLKEIKERLKAHKILSLSLFIPDANKFFNVKKTKSFKISSLTVNSYNNSFTDLLKDLLEYKKLKYKTVYVTSSNTRKERLVKDFNDNGLIATSLLEELQDGVVFVTASSLFSGFIYPEHNFAVISENDIFKKTTSKKRKNTQLSFEELSLLVGDYVVHTTYGIGIYKGIVKQVMDGVEKDYIHIEYAKNANLYVLATQTDAIQKYFSSDADKKPALSVLGGSSWKKTKEKIEKSVSLVAKDLVKLYAKRSLLKGFIFDKDNYLQHEFEETFPYEETKDQINAINEIKADMESETIMDRLLCGDVGFGKTEVAMRAAFKAVQSGKQVAFLAPTTILASQHFNTFSLRLKNFPINVSLLSSMKSTSENKDTIASLKTGLTDIVIGTHRLLSKDVSFKNLGFLIVDEEQRFGVSHKEKIKQLKEDVDVLSLSATPIPRTLSLSLSGIRQMSVLNEAPIDRLPIETFVSSYDVATIKTAIQREINRNGQVYYVYNRVEKIEEVYNKLSSLLPNVSFAYAHGQMDKKKLNEIMHKFINKEIDVLIATTIIETGVDVPNANTMIIEDANKLGLSQLYQLRGRVGRTNRQGYAFLFYSRGTILSDTAKKRMLAISSYTNLGSGYRLAMKDLEIRGAGSFLGKSQHGHMALVGFELYTKMLNEAIMKEKGILIPAFFETIIDIEADAYLPSSYVFKEAEKLSLYKRIANLSTREDFLNMADELTDRYGKMPLATKNLLNIAFIKSIAHSCFICELKGGEKNTAWVSSITFANEEISRLSTENIRDIGNKFFMDLSLIHLRKLSFKISKIKAHKIDEYLSELTNFLNKLKSYIE